MELTGERFLPQMKGVIEYEHLIRYLFVVQQLNLKGKTVVDIASGEGYGSEIMSREASEVIGVDISSEAVEYANKKYIKENLKYIQGDACKIPLDDDFADVFVSFETIEHHDKHHEMLSEIKRVLKPDGILIMSSPDKKNYSEIPGYDNPYHVKELYYEEFKKLISGYFKHSFFFSQNNISGSVITADFGHDDKSSPDIIDLNQNLNKFFPLYNIVITTDNEGFKPSGKQIMCGEFRMLTDEDIFQAQQEVRRTMEYRLGRKILKRLKFLKKFL